MKRFKIIVITALLSVLWVNLATAHQPNMSDERAAYITRDGLMHLLNSQRYILIRMLTGQSPVDQGEFVRSAKAVSALLSMIPVAFEKNLMVDESRAEADIWTNWDDFVSVAETQSKLAAEIAALAEINGAESVLQRVREFDCGSCHGPYRK
jgi:cytochrome c556